MKCPIGKVKAASSSCDAEECGIWDKKKTQCGMLTYMQAYYAMGMATLRMVETTDRMEKSMEEDDD